MAWRFVLTDKNFVPQGEVLNAPERRVALPLSKLDTASLRMRLDNPLADAALACDGYLKGYRNGSLLYVGPVISAEENTERGKASVMVNSVSMGWFLQKRLAGKSATGRLFTALTDRASIAKTLISEANIENEMGISTALAVSSGARVTYAAGPYKPIYTCLTELSQSFDGFDWRFLPVENYDNGVVTGTKLASFRALPVLGEAQPDAVFEYGTGRSNVVSYKRLVARDQQANKVYHNTSNGPGAPGYPTVSAIDGGSISDFRLLEDLAELDLLDPTMRQQLVAQHVELRARPRTVIEFQPQRDDGTGRMPRFGIDYDVGDTVRSRAFYNGKQRFDIMSRIYGVEFSISDMGSEDITLKLVDEGVG